MAKLATFVVAAVLGVTLGIIGVIATLGAVSPSADTIANESNEDPTSNIYGTP
jgi:hypothetical protein